MARMSLPDLLPRGLLLLPLFLLACGRDEKLPEPPKAEVREAQVRVEATDDRVRFLLDSPKAYPVTVTLRVKASNLQGSQRLPYVRSVQAAKDEFLFELQRSDAARPYDYSYKLRWQCGDKRAVHDSTQVYRLPYADGDAHELIQGPGGSYSHQDASYHAYDFEMPEGTEVLAARAGVVCATKADSNIGGPDHRYDSDANYVAVVHGDGTVGWYLHLRKEGASVYPGDVVAAGQRLGYSGNTGYSARPHLHFQVHRPLNGDTYRSLQIRIATDRGVFEAMETGERYRAVALP